MRFTTYYVDCDDPACAMSLESTDSMMIPRLMFLNSWHVWMGQDFCQAHAPEGSSPAPNWMIRGSN